MKVLVFVISLFLSISLWGQTATSDLAENLPDSPSVSKLLAEQQADGGGTPIKIESGSRSFLPAYFRWGHDRQCRSARVQDLARKWAGRFAIPDTPFSRFAVWGRDSSQCRYRRMELLRQEKTPELAEVAADSSNRGRDSTKCSKL